MESFVNTAFAPLRDIIRLLRGDYYGYETSPYFAAAMLMLLLVALVGFGSYAAAGRSERRGLVDRAVDQ